jgi:PLP dependent protein
MFMLRERIEQVEERLRGACERAGRRREEVTLLAVTKLFPASAICEAYALGLREFGENYVQEFEGKAAAVAGLEGARFHLIGHLQSNKSKVAAALFDVIQTVDSARLARRLNDAPERRVNPIETMIEVKLSQEQAKSGVGPEELAALIDAISACPALRLTGLMTMPPWSDDPEPSRPYFRRLRELAKQYGLPALSMGMSHDLEIAIEEGATIVRVGTALFGRRVKP